MPNPIPILTKFFHNAKSSRNTKYSAMTGYDYEAVKTIIANDRYRGFSEFSLANLMLALAYKKAKWQSLKKFNLTQGIIDSLCYYQHTFNARSISNILWGLAQIGISKQEFKESGLENIFIKLIHRDIKQFNQQDLSNLFLALAQLDFTWEEIKDWGIDRDLLDAIKININKFNVQCTTNVIWCLAHFEMTWQELKDAQLEAPLLSIIQQNTQDKDDSHLTQIKQAQLWFGFKLPDKIQDDFEKRLKALPYPKSSQLHLKIASVFQQLAKPIFFNEYCYDSVLFSDITFPSLRLVFEVDGPYHEPHLDRLKTKLLAKRGIKTVRIDYRDDLSESALKNLLQENNVPLKNMNVNFWRANKPAPSALLEKKSQILKLAENNEANINQNATLAEIQNDQNMKEECEAVQVVADKLENNKPVCSDEEEQPKQPKRRKQAKKPIKQQKQQNSLKPNAPLNSVTVIKNYFYLGLFAVAAISSSYLLADKVCNISLDNRSP